MKQAIPERNQVDSRYKWHIEDYYSSFTQWEEAFRALNDALPKLSSLAETFCDSAENFWGTLKTLDETSMQLDRVYTYANMRLHEDGTNAQAQSMASRAEQLLISFSAATAFVTPTILSLPEETLDAYLRHDPTQAKLYAHFLDNILRQKAHTLSYREEMLLAKSSELGGAPQQIFAMLNDADIRFDPVLTAEGETLELTKGRYITYLESQDRTLRQNAFHSLYRSYQAQKNTIAAIYSASVKSDVFFAKERNYASSMEMALEDDHIPLSVYDNLIETVHRHLPLLHRYVSLRKRLLGVEELHMYDLYVPLVAEAEQEIPFDQAKKTVLEALAVLGKDYTAALKHGMESGWIDVCENRGKRGGAYSWGSYGVHPFVLLNHNDTINSMFTLAHEMGHALHSYFTWEKQPYLYSGHKIFVAEVASTCNEALLMEHLLKTTPEGAARRYLVNYFLEQFRGTFFRQTMFAEFEKITHEMAERGEALTQETLSKIYHDLNVLYFGNDIVIDEDIDIEWARIPHFYNAFYVYQYATGYSAAIALSRRILTEGEPAIKDYLDFLSKGNSEYSIDLLKGAGVDMSSQKPLEDAIAQFVRLLDEMESWL